MCIKSLSELGSHNKNTKPMPWLRLYGTDLPKIFGRTSEKARYLVFHLQWEVKQEIKQSLSCEENTFQHCRTHQNTVKLAILCNKI